MRDFAYIKAEPFENHFRVNDEAARAQFEAWIMLFFQDQDSGGKTRVDLCQMERGGKSTGAAAKDEDIFFHSLILP